MVSLATATLQLANAIFAYIKDAKSRHTREALHIAVRIKHIDELVVQLKKTVNKTNIKKVQALKSKKKRLWKAFDKRIAAN